MLLAYINKNSNHRRLINPDQLSAWIKLKFPDAKLVSIDVSNTGLSFVQVAQLYSEADVVITSRGLHNVLHSVLPNGAKVVDLEGGMLGWNDLEFGDDMMQLLRANRFSLYRTALLRNGIIVRGLTDVDYATVRALSDFRVNLYRFENSGALAINNTGEGGSYPVLTKTGNKGVPLMGGVSWMAPINAYETWLTRD